MADPIKWEIRAIGALSEIRQLLAHEEQHSIRYLHELTDELWASPSLSGPVACAGNQHTCMPTLFVPQLNGRFDLVFTGSGDSMIVGHHLGPRALVWKNTTLSCSHPVLGDMTITLDPANDHAGTLLPLQRNQPFPAFNRNVYYFVLNSTVLGELISEKPAIVESLIDQVPPIARYEFKNPPLHFYLRSDPEKRVVARVEKAVTDVRPA